jgi:hypothetical protein
VAAEEYNIVCERILSYRELVNELRVALDKLCDMRANVRFGIDGHGSYISVNLGLPYRSVSCMSALVEWKRAKEGA